MLTAEKVASMSEMAFARESFSSFPIAECSNAPVTDAFSGIWLHPKKSIAADANIVLLSSLTGSQLMLLVFISLLSAGCGKQLRAAIVVGVADLELS